MSQSLPDCDSGDRSQEKQAMCKIYSGSGDIQYLVAMMAGESAMAPRPRGMPVSSSSGIVSSVGLATQVPLVPTCILVLQPFH